MEAHQKIHIETNKLRLTELTTCNTLVITALQSRGILSKSEAQQLETRLKNDGDLAAAQKFYDIMVMKKDSYKILIEVFIEARLTGAVGILQEIYTSNTQSSAGAEKGLQSGAKEAETASTHNSEAEKPSAESSLDVIAKKKIGTEEDCDVSIEEIMSIVTDSATIKTMLQNGKWKTIAMKLSIPKDDRDKWSHEITLEKASHLDVFEMTLVQWSSNKGDEATLGKLMNIVEKCGMKSFSDKMKKIFE